MIDSVDVAFGEAWEEPAEAACVHGAVVGRTIQALACPVGRTCDLPIRGVRALEYGECLMPGGCQFGDPLGLAQKVFEAATSTRAGIIVVSLGWDGDIVSPASYEAEAVRHAITLARCLGNLVIVAAGNDLAYPPLTATITALLEPAQTLRGEVVDDTACQSFGFGPRGLSEDMVVVVGGATAAGRAIRQTLPGAMLDLFAPAVESAPQTAGGHLPTTSGSSLGPAVFAASASIVWAATSTLTAGQVADRVKNLSVSQSASIIERSRDLTTPSYSVVRVVDAVKATCGCNPLPFVSTTGAPTWTSTLPRFSVTPEPPGMCSDLMVVPPALCNTYAVPTYDADDYPATFPQPTGPICTKCDLFLSSGLLALEVDPGSGVAVKYLEVTDGNDVTLIDLSETMPMGQSPKAQYEVDVGGTLPSNVDSARVLGEDRNGTTSSTEVKVYP
ncbi:MAG: hypothetical protein RIT81_47145 [Deltaproteobacteria bacterium]